MKKLLVTILLLLPLTATAFTISNPSGTTRKVTAPQLFTSTLSSFSTLQNFELSTSTKEDTVSLPSASLVTVNDIVYNQSTTGSVNYSCYVNFPSNGTITAVNPSIATTDATGNLTYVSSGLARFNVNVGRLTKQTTCTTSQTNSATSNVFSSIASGSLGAYLNSTTTVRVQSLSPSASTYNIFSSTDDTNHVYTRNTSLWASTTDLTSIPATNGTGYNTDRGILVAPDIRISAAHACGTGTTYFVDNNNNVYSRTVTATLTVGTDICVSKLDSDVPASIHFAKVLPANFSPTKISSALLQYRLVPVAYTNQARELRIGALVTEGNITTVNQATSTAAFSSWWQGLGNGDSGNAVVAFINGQTVAIGTWFTAGSSSDIANYLSSINSVMTSLGSIYQLTTVDLSGFPTY